MSFKDRITGVAARMDPSPLGATRLVAPCGILFEADNGKPIVRLYFDRREK